MNDRLATASAPDTRFSSMGDPVSGSAMAQLAARLAGFTVDGQDRRNQEHERRLCDIRRLMSVDALHGALASKPVGEGRVLLDPPPGTGKSHAIKDYLASVSCRDRYGLVIYLVPSHQLARAVAADLEQRGLSVYRYPSVDDALCAATPLGERIRQHKVRGTSALAEREICHGECQDQCSCPYVHRVRSACIPSRFQIVVAPSAVARARPDQLATWAGERPALTVLDDTFDHVSQYVERFHRKEVADVVRVLEEADQGTGDLAVHLAEVTKVAERGERMFPLRFTPQQRLAVESAAERLGVDLTMLSAVVRWGQAPLWSDGTVCASQQFPRWAGDVLVSGAYLDAGFVAPRLGLTQLTEMVPARPLQHPSTTLVQITGMQGSVSYWKGNRGCIARMAADVIQEAQRHGLGTVLLTRKDGEGPGARPLRTMTCAAVIEELRRRGDDRTVITEGPDETPDPRRIPVVTYGAIGLNAYQGYPVLVSLVSYHVDQAAVVEAAYGTVHPDQRPRVMMGRRRRPQVEASGDRNAVAKAYFLAEVSVLLQAMARVRFTIEPRIVVFFCPHRLDRVLGEVRRVDRPAQVGQVLGLDRGGSQKRAMAGLQRQDQAVKAYRDGATAVAIAHAMEVSEKSVRRWLAAAGMDCRRGRPPNDRE